jgi:hypothetical protein
MMQRLRIILWLSVLAWSVAMINEVHYQDVIIALQRIRLSRWDDQPTENRCNSKATIMSCAVPMLNGGEEHPRSDKTWAAVKVREQ